VTESQWQTNQDPQAMLAFLRMIGKASERKLRLFAVASSRRILMLMVDERSRNAVEVAERFADGHSSTLELENASFLARDAPAEQALLAEVQSPLAYGVAAAALFCVHDSAFTAALEVASEASNAAAFTNRHGSEAAEQAKLLRCIFGNPFRPLALDASLLSFTVVKMAQAIYEERAFERMAVLADALEENGITGEALAHCRSDTPHARGCHVIDLILGKK
jgi:hypothetical protein